MSPEGSEICSICRQVHQGGLSTEQKLLHAIANMERFSGKASTRALAVRLHLSEVQTWRYLKQMEMTGQVQRVGRRGGWQRVA
jgi:Mn-dependent DtxR family transcriptional regulator